jgi:hypothetical protein
LWIFIIAAIAWALGFPIKIKYPNGVTKRYRWFHVIK